VSAASVRTETNVVSFVTDSFAEFVQAEDQRLEEGKGERKAEVDHSEFA
jgi:hypothetical protein